MHNIDENEVLRNALSGLNEDVPPMPEGLHAAWMQKVEESNMEKTTTRKSITRFLSIAAALVFVVGGTLLTRGDLYVASDDLKAGQNNSAPMLGAAYANEYGYAADAIEEEYAFMDMAAGADTGMVLSSAKRTSTTTDEPAAEADAVTEKKIIRTASLTISTQTYDESLEALKAFGEGSGGWIESFSENTNSSTGLRRAYLTLRIPQSSLDAALTDMETLGRITSRSETAQDVTASYQDTQTRLNTQLALMERLQALITESGDLSDLLALESQIADTQYMIDSLQQSLTSTDRQVTYSTVDVTLREEATVELTDTTVSLGERIRSAIVVGWETFTGFLSDMVVFIVAALPFIAVVIAAYIIGKIVIRKRRNK